MFGKDDHYDIELNTGELSVGWLKETLNDRWNDGWALKDIFVQNGNTIVGFERQVH